MTLHDTLPPVPSAPGPGVGPGSPGTPPRDRSLRIALLAIGSALVVLLIGLGVVQIALAAAGAGRGDDSGGYTPSAGFEALDLDVSAAEVTVAYGDVDEARFDFDSGGSSLRFDQRMRGDTLYVTVGDQGWWPFHFFDLGQLGDAALDVTLPNTMEPAGLDVDSSAGSVTVDGDYGVLALETSAGNVELSGSARELSLESSAGNLTGTDLEVTGAVRSESSAGDTVLAFSSLPSSITVESSAGNVRVALPDGSYEIRTEISAGSLSQDVPSTPGADRVYSFETSAGNVTLEPAR